MTDIMFAWIALLVICLITIVSAVGAFVLARQGHRLGYSLLKLTRKNQQMAEESWKIHRLLESAVESLDKISAESVNEKEKRLHR